MPIRQPPPERLLERRRLGERLLLLRRRAELSQEQLAASVGVTRATVLAWEDGRGEPQLFDACKLGEVLGVDIDVLTGAEPMPRE